MVGRKCLVRSFEKATDYDKNLKMAEVYIYPTPPPWVECYTKRSTVGLNLEFSFS